MALTALSRLDVRAVLAFQPGNHTIALPWLAGGGLSTLLYFLFGFALLSLTKFIHLHTHWRLEGVPVSSRIAGRWAWYSLIVLAFLALMVSLLPTHYSLGFISFLHWLTSLIIAFVIFIIGLFWTLFMLPIMALQSPFLQRPSERLPGLPQPLATPTLPETDTLTTLPAWELIKPYLIWGLFLIVAIYVLRHYLLQHEALLRTVQKAPLTRWCQQLWRWLARQFRKMNLQFSVLVTAGAGRLRAANPLAQPGDQDRFASPWRLHPRQQIHFYCHALLRGAAAGGFPRKSTQTPGEYAARLAEKLSESKQKIDIISNSFIRARHTPQEFTTGDVSLLKRQWQRIRKALRNSRSDRRR